MKIKFLLPALAGLAMVSCSQDDDFVDAEMQRGEFSPVTFSVSRENGADTREWMEDENGRWDNFTFVKGELLSLFNGATFGDGAAVWTPSAVFIKSREDAVSAFDKRCHLVAFDVGVARLWRTLSRLLPSLAFRLYWYRVKTNPHSATRTPPRRASIPP